VSSQPVRPGTSNYFHSLTLCISTPEQGITPAAARRYVPADFSSTVAYRFAANQAIMDPKIAVDLRTSLVAGGG